jgi:hypothetical protein
MPSPIRPLVLIPLLALACLLASGCASFPRASDDVSVTLVNLRPLESTPFETRLVLTVRVTNAGPEPLRLSGARHRLALNGRALGSAVTPEALEIPALSSATQEATFNLSHLALLPLLHELRRDPSARYEMESAFFGSGLSSRRLTTRHEGRLDLSAFADSTNLRSDTFPAAAPAAP